MNAETPPVLTESVLAALRDGADVLETEANVLAELYDKNKLKDFHYRVDVAVRTEMRRLRAIAQTLRSLIPKPPTEDEE